MHWQVIFLIGMAAWQGAGLAALYMVFQTNAGAAAIDWQVVLLALIAAVPPTVASWLAYRKANEAKAASTEVGHAVEVVKKQTDGLASAMKNAGFAEGVKQEQDAAAVATVADARQAAMIEEIVRRLNAEQSATQAASAPVVPSDPGPRVARQLGDIKDVVDDVQPRVVAIETATADRDAAVEKVATSADDRLTKLEEKES